MDFNALYHANFKLLDDAVTDWSTLVKHLVDLKKDAEDDLHKAAVKADWAGVNAQVSKQFIGKTAGEFGDAHTQATTIHNILRDTRDELKSFHQQLTDAVSRGQKKNLTVVDAGGGKFSVMGNTRPDWSSDPSGKTSATNQKDVDDLRDEIQGILSKATESDNTAKDVLTAIVDQTRMGFSDASYKDRDTAADAVKEADELAKLAKKDPDDLSVKDFDRLNAGLKKYHDDPLFSERFAKDLGPEKTLSFWANVSDPMVTPDLTHERREQLGELQKNLGLTLATASQSDTADMTEWKRHMVEIGDESVQGKRGNVLGFQVMSNLMRVGDYDDDFMKQYGKSLMETERKFTSDGKHTAWQRLGFDPYLNHMAGDSGFDPLSGYLKGLSNNPGAATDFFNDDFIPKDGDHKEAVSNFKYLFEDRHWPHESNSDLSQGESTDGRNNLASALEAAATGHPAGELPTGDTPAHTPGQAKLFENIVSSISDDNGRITDHSYMSDSMGQIASEYLPDIDRATTDVDRHPGEHDAAGQAAWERLQKLYPVQGTAADMNHSDVSRFLFAVGQDPHGYAAVEVGQKNYMGKLLEYHLNPDLPADQRPDHDMELTVRDIARHSGQVSGTLAMGRNEAVAGPADLKDKDFDHSVAQWKNFLSGTVGTGVGVGTSFIASPAVGAGVGGAAGTATSMMLEELFKDAEGSAKDDAGAKIGKDWENGNQANMKYTSAAAYNAAKQYHLSGDVATWAEQSSSQGFLEGGGYMERVGAELVTDI
ncbi:hypothetical protein JK361_26300 [Streptomyces sp. 5-8]|uniref:WXG100 family type VII secretion target n=1 Tax=Streptomyces musisoli TaxID=2802280 RepID=A0ABS1P728_9ACTN|nr:MULTISPECIES: hypothetical protein [Streptomyces]MBL1108059.1 hypothetical protein [Streptomyces musisoli]MBY8841424.1 hypothetical protein [Streptomyces sp. SP2-10]